MRVEAPPPTPFTGDPDATSGRRRTWIVGIALVLAGVVTLGVWAFASPGAFSYYVTPSEVAADDLGSDDTPLRVGGRVADGTLDRDGAVVRFVVTDGDADVPVRYAGEVPDTLKESTDVIAEGRIGPDGILEATSVLAKCSSKYVPVDEVDEHTQSEA